MKVTFPILVLTLALLTAVPALGQSDPTSAQYQDQVTQVVGDGDSGGPSGPESRSSGRQPALEQNIVGGLPITGLDVFALAAVALALTAMGFALRRLTVGHDDC